MPMSSHDANLLHSSEADQALEPLQAQRRLGFLQAQAVLDADLKAHFAAEIGTMFAA
ncbi:hypothetical protein [Synechococcus sp. LA31]|uniref:hypothetical protein n=1 Tax=Synechococcus sp. LA31 TaxID=2741953 RepID=UPI001BDC0916|nr:hypothetical protein [Synechococcus sp. LA31]QVV67256.1 hypothetical protein KJJ24_12605 [Synechococcus sp. LA31]